MITQQQILDFLKSGSKSTFELCDQFGLSIVDMRKILDTLKKQGHIWQRKQRTFGKRQLSRWGLKESQ